MRYNFIKILNYLYLIFIFCSCDKIDKKSLTVIEGIELGKDYQVFMKQLDSLGLESKVFYTKTFISENEEIGENRIKAYTTDIFNLSNYKNGSNHYGILYATNLAGTNNVTGLEVIMGHEADLQRITDHGVYNLSKSSENKSFNQNITIELCEEIKSLLKSKYGTPKLELSSAYFNIIEGNDIKKYRGFDDTKTKLTMWETENLEIEFIEGITSNKVSFTKKGYSYSFHPEGKENDPLQIDWKAGDKECKSYVHICYKLKPETIKKLNLNEKKL